MLDLTGRKRSSHTGRQLQKGPGRQSDHLCAKHSKSLVSSFTGTGLGLPSGSSTLDSNSDLHVSIVLEALEEFLPLYCPLSWINIT